MHRIDKYIGDNMCNVYIVPDIDLLYNVVSKEVIEMPASKAQQKAVAKYMSANYDEIKVRVMKGQKDKIKAHVAITGESVNAFITRAIEEAMTRDQSK